MELSKANSPIRTVEDWERVAGGVPTRTGVQCRNRWIDKMDPKRRDTPFLWEEYKRLLFGIAVLGRRK